MRISAIICLLAIYSTAWSNCITEASVDFALGPRTDSFGWGFCDDSSEKILSVPLPAVDANYRSHWKKMRMINFGIEGSVVSRSCLYASVSANYGWVCDGHYAPGGFFKNGGELIENALSDYGVAPPSSKRAGGHAWDVSGGVGYRITRCEGALEFVPMIGWSYYNIHFFTDHYLSYSAFYLNPRFLPPKYSDIGFAALKGAAKADFNSNWNGPWIGFDAAYHWDCSLSFLGTFQYHFARQFGSGAVDSENSLFYSEDIDDDNDQLFYITKNGFSTRNDLNGIFIRGGIHYDFAKRWFLGFHVDYWNMQQASSGHLELANESEFFLGMGGSDGSFSAKKCFGLQNMCWESLRFNLVLGLNF